MTTFFDASQLMSQWPAGIEHNASESTYVYSVSNTWQINPLDHIHVVAIDEHQVAPGVPNVITLTLPVLETLPFSSRIYFFYVSEANAGDELVFIPLSGSGNTVNGNALGYTFTLSGQKQLIFAFGLRSNYIIHNAGFNQYSGPAVTTRSGVLSKMLYFVSPTPGSGLMTNFYGTTTGLKSMFYPNNNAMDVLQPFGDVDISSYITRNVAVPTKGVYGFQVNQPGWYHVQLNLEAGIQWDSNAGQNVWADLAVCNAAGALTQHYRGADCCQSYYISTTNYPTIMCSQYIKFDAGDFLIFSYSGIGAAIVTTTYTQASVAFVYYGGTPTTPAAPPAAPRMLSLFSEAGGAPVPEPSPVESLVAKSASVPLAVPEASLSKQEAAAVSAPVHAPAPKDHVVSLQKKHRAGLAAASRSSVSSSSAAGSSSSSSGSGPSFTLQDIEKIIGRALDARQRESAGSLVPPSIGGADVADASMESEAATVTVPSTTPSRAPPASKKRKTITPSSTEESIL